MAARQRLVRRTSTITKRLTDTDVARIRRTGRELWAAEAAGTYTGPVAVGLSVGVASIDIDLEMPPPGIMQALYTINGKQYGMAIQTMKRVYRGAGEHSYDSSFSGGYGETGYYPGRRGPSRPRRRADGTFAPKRR